jgi:K+-sensing histidine kinase KdpD
VSNADNDFDFATYLMSSVHDIKNSLGMLINTLEDVSNSTNIEDCPFGGEIARMEYEAKRANNNLIQLLGLYKLNSMDFSPNLGEYNLEDFLDEILIEYEPLFRFNQIEASADCDPELEWYFDRTLINSIINNVLNNQVRYGKGEVKLTADEEDGYLVLRIHDNGDGYPEHMLSQTDFSQNPMNHQTGGTGLGLHFSAVAAQAHTNQDRSGHIKISNDSELGGGCFAVYIP